MKTEDKRVISVIAVFLFIFAMVMLASGCSTAPKPKKVEEQMDRVMEKAVKNCKGNHGTSFGYSIETENKGRLYKSTFSYVCAQKVDGVFEIQKGGSL